MRFKSPAKSTRHAHAWRPRPSRVVTTLVEICTLQKELGERYDDDIAARTRALVDRLLLPGSAAAVRDVSEEGLRLLSDLYVEEVTLCEMWGNARPEEGSEHYVAYALEALTGTHLRK